MTLDLLTGKKAFTSLKPIDLSKCTKREIEDYFKNSYDVYESIFLGLKSESTLYKCPDRLRLPLVFYYGHTASVYVNKLMLAGLLKQRVNMPFETMFETGVDEMSWDDTENYRMGGSYKWPTMKDIVEYRREVRESILKIIRDTPLLLPITMDSPWWAVMMGIEHERVHLETSAVLIRQLPINLVSCPTGWNYGPVLPDHPVKANKMVAVAKTKVTLGKPKDFPSYGWDNEYGELTLKVPAFEASQYMVTNKEFLEFVQAGGYTTRQLWSEEGWEWVQFRQARHPTFWVCDQGCKSGCGSDLAVETHCTPRPTMLNETTNDNQPECKRLKLGEYRLRLIFDVVDLPLDWPVEVNFHEAKAFCSWKGEGYRVMTEAEHNVIRGPMLPASKGPMSDIMFHDQIQANINFQFGSSTPVNMYEPSATGHYDSYGNAAEWVEDHFNGLPGFETHKFYDDFSSPCFDGKHNFLVGGSWISTGDYGSRYARIGFRRHFFQFCGFRLTRSKNPEDDLTARWVDTEVYVLGSGVQDNKKDDKSIIKQKPVLVQSTNEIYTYDTRETLEGILELEFGFCDSLPCKIADFCRNICSRNLHSLESAVQIGSATGRVAFELSKNFDKVLGIEMHSRLIDTALSLKEGKKVTFKGTDIKLDDDYNKDRVTFTQLTWIANEVDSHDFVLLTCLDRAQNPEAWLLRLWEITKPHGVAVVVSEDGSWGGDALRPFLNARLQCIGEENIIFDNAGESNTATATIWKRRV